MTLEMVVTKGGYPQTVSFKHSRGWPATEDWWHYYRSVSRKLINLPVERNSRGFRHWSEVFPLTCVFMSFLGRTTSNCFFLKQMAAISCQVGEWAFRTDVATELVEALDEGLSPGAITGREPGEHCWRTDEWFSKEDLRVNIQSIEAFDRASEISYDMGFQVIAALPKESDELLSSQELFLDHWHWWGNLA